MMPPSYPASFYVFLDMANVVCHNNITLTKSISSAGFSSAGMDSSFRKDYLAGTVNYFPFIPNPNSKPRCISLFNLSATSHYLVEYNAERVRRLSFPLAPSRLSAVYAFGTQDDCNRAHQLYGWDSASVRRFRLVPHPLNRVMRVNMEVVTLMRFAQRRANWNEGQINAIWNHYWSGAGSLQVEVPVVKNGGFDRETVSSGEIWEYLIEGQLKLEEDNDA